MRSLLGILTLWRGRAGWLIGGTALSLGALACALTLMDQAGGRIALAGAGLLTATVALQLVGPARVFLRYFERLVTHDATFRALADTRVWFFRGFAKRSAGGLGFIRSGDLLSRLVNDVEALDGLYLRILLPLAGAMLVIPVLVLVIGPKISGWWLPAAIGGLSLISALVLPAIAARVASGSGERLAIAVSGLRTVAVDLLTGLREVRVFSAEERMRELISARETELIAAQQQLAHRAAWTGAAAFLCGQVALLLLLAASGHAPVQSIAAAFLVLAGFEALGGLPRAGLLAGHAMAAARRVLDAALGVASYPDPPRPSVVPPGFTLRFEGVHFRWQADRAEVFMGLTMEVQAGSRVAILGPSGAGKSTIAALALKVARPQLGQVLLGGEDIANFSAADVRSRISYLSQATHLFEDTIRVNLTLGRAIDEPTLWTVLEQAGIADVVRSLPEGIDSWLGEGGSGLSGGQGRRLALARALLSTAPILLFDEPCSGLDADTERAFMTTLNQLTDNRTIILIVHRLIGVERLDRIWRISQGHAIAAAG